MALATSAAAAQPADLSPPGALLPPPEMIEGPPLAEPKPVGPADPTLLAPLPPLEQFDVAPRSDFTFRADAEHSQRYRVDVEGLGETGIEGRFRQLSELVGAAGKPATAAQINSRTRVDRAMLERLLFSEGWYGAIVRSAIGVAEGDGQTVRVQFSVVAGTRYRWRSIALDLYPDAPPGLGTPFGLKTGQPIRAADVDQAEGALLLDIRRRGYPFATIGARDVLLHDADATGDYLLTADIGPRARFGKVYLARHKPFSDAHAQVIARFRPGDLYDADKVDDLRLALIQTQLFGGVTVVPEDSGARAPDGTAITDIRVDAGRGPKRQWAGQVGYSTGEGARVDLQWRHRNLVVPEGGFTALGVIGTREQRVGASLAMANWGQRDRTLTTMFDVANVNRPAFQARTATAAATLARASTPIFQKRWTWSAGAELIASDELDRSFDPNAPRQTYLIAALPLALGYDRSNSLLDPTGGWRAGLRVSPEFSQQGGNTSTYLRLTGDVSGYQQLSDPLVLAARARVASILGAQRIDIAPTRRLYAGGGGSVRGYDYQDVGPLGADDRPLGGRALTEGSVEARYRFGDFGVVAFVDAGTLTESSTPTLSDVHVGAGIGGRYYTSFGPIRVDVARALNNRTRAPAFALYISIGQAF